ITTSGTSYYTDASFLDRLEGTQQTPMIKTLKKEYRSFMRGKNEDPSFFFENETVVLYGDVTFKYDSHGPKDFTFNISVLDKKTGKTDSFQAEVPSSGNMSHMTVLNVQMVNDKLTMITENSYTGEKNIKAHVYSFDVSDHKLNHDETITTIRNQDENHYSHTFMVNKAKPDGSYVVFSNRVMEDVVEGEGYTVKEISRALIRYDLETNKKESIAFPEKVHQDAEPFAFNGSTIYFAGITDQYLEVTPYDIKSKKTGKKLEIKLQSIDNGWKMPLHQIKDGKLYVVTQPEKVDVPAEIHVLDLKSGDTLYQGEIVPESPTVEDKQYDFHLQKFGFE